MVTGNGGAPAVADGSGLETIKGEKVVDDPEVKAGKEPQSDRMSGENLDFELQGQSKWRECPRTVDGCGRVQNGIESSGCPGKVAGRCGIGCEKPEECGQVTEMFLREVFGQGCTGEHVETFCRRPGCC